MNKQIEELSKDIFEHCSAGLFEDEAEEIARFVIEGQGYCKASDVAVDIIRILRAAGIDKFRYPVIAEIEKKYTEEGERDVKTKIE